MAMAGSSVVILGGGVGGLVVANLLHDRLAKRAQVIVVDQKKVFQFAPSLSLGDDRPAKA
jgi:NADH dehydrogenase FAD-containing subunit